MRHAEVLLMSIQEDPSFPAAYRSLAACYAHMGRLDEAREIVHGCGHHLRRVLAYTYSETRSTVNCSSRACAWRLARQT